jgi:glycosyltransferase involved in cell wall biosynthesis
MKIFGTLDQDIFHVASYITPGKRMIYGAWVGEESFYNGLLTWGSFDEYHFFVNSTKAGNIFKKKLLLLNINTDKVRIIDIKELAVYLKKIEYTIFFTHRADISNLVYLRAKYARKCFPVCGLVLDAISYPEAFRQTFLNNIIADVRPFDSIICPSRAVLKVIRKHNKLLSLSFKENLLSGNRYNGRLDVLPFGIDINDYGALNKLKARRELGLDKDKVIVLYFGRFSLYDKADLYPLLLAFKEVLKEKRNAMLLLAGIDLQHEYGEKLKRVAKEMGILPHTKFILHNFLDKKNLLFTAADIFVSPSDNIQETFGLTVLEAMATSLPVVVSDWDGYKDTVIHNKTGFRIPTYCSDYNIEAVYPGYSAFKSWQLEHLYFAQSVCVDVKRFVEYLSILVKDKTLRLTFGHNARNNVLQKYDWRVLIPEYEKLWERLSRLSDNAKINRKISQYFSLKYFDSFSHYPTRILNKKTRVSISENGTLFLKFRKLSFKIEKELLDILSFRVIFIILSLLSRENAVSIGKIEKYLKSNFNVQVSLVRYHIMWLLKKDLIRRLSG